MRIRKRLHTLATAREQRDAYVCKKEKEKKKYIYKWERAEKKRERNQ